MAVDALTSSLAALQDVLDCMPAVRAMQIRLDGYADGVLRITAPLVANVNDKGNAFGGSLASVLTLSGWALVSLRLRLAGHDAEVYVADSNLRYLADGRALDADVVERVVLRMPGVASAHKIRTRGAPGAIHVDLHIQIARHLDVVTAHRVTHWVIEAIKRDIPGVADVLVHTEPAREGQSYNPLPESNLER